MTVILRIQSVVEFDPSTAYRTNTFDIMENKSIAKSDFFSWRTEDFTEYQKLNALSPDANGFSGVNIYISICRIFFLHSIAFLYSKTDKIATISSNGDIDACNVKIQCENCDQTFTISTFDEHICDYSDRKTFVYDDKLVDFLWNETALPKMYMENNKMIQQILCQNTVESSNQSTDIKRPMVEAHHVCPHCHRMYVHASGNSINFEVNFKF